MDECVYQTNWYNLSLEDFLQYWCVSYFLLNSFYDISGLGSYKDTAFTLYIYRQFRIMDIITIYYLIDHESVKRASHGVNTFLWKNISL